MGTAPALSVVIPTVPSRAHYLRACLGALSACDDIDRAEVLVVTEQPSEMEALLRGWSVGAETRVVASGRPLSEKRNAGVDRSVADLIAFLDDDTEPEVGYVTGMLEAFDGGAAIVAGRVEPVFEAPVPARLVGQEDLIRGFNALGDWRRSDFTIGANLAFRREVFERVGPFDRNFGRGGRRYDHGEESELVTRASSSFAPVFAEAAAVKHAIQPRRLETGYLHRRSWEAGMTISAIDEIHRTDYARNTVSVALMLPILALRAIRRPRDIRPRLRVLFVAGYLVVGLRTILLRRGDS